MAAITAWLLKRASAMKTLTDAGIVVFFLAMMASMFASATIYLDVPTLLTVLELVALNMVFMSLGLLPVLVALFRGDRPLGDPSSKERSSARVLAVSAVVALAILSEMFMGWTFAILSGAVSTSGGSVAGGLVESMSTYWFVFTMASEMAVTLHLLGRGLPAAFRWLIALQVAIMVLSPTAIAGPEWSTPALVGNSLVMIAVIIVVFEFIFQNRALSEKTSKYIVRLIGAYSLMMAGLFLWLMSGDVLLFVVSLAVEMGVYFLFVLDARGITVPPLVAWQSRPVWTFALLGGVFLTEFFMGGVLDVAALGRGYFTSLPFAMLGGSLPGVLGAAFFDFVVAASSVTASFWFLAMMGVEMGALVVFKIKYAREFETKVRLALVIVAYAIYSLFLPLFVLGSSLPSVPWMGWSMGLGTAGALAPSVILALVSTYLISGGLSFLFGARQVCSLFCTAALMYQGTATDAMSSFNRTSRIGRHLLTSRIPSAYKVVITVVWVSLLASAAVSYLASVGLVRFSFFGQDPGYFFFAFYFSFLWYLVWVTIPFVGTYGCSTTGMWGSFNQLVSRLGLFRLKVKDSNACINCKTKDCARVCPVGLTDMPGSFIDKGEFRSFKCIGVGDCVSACPYENVFFFDARNWVRTKLNRPLPPLSKSADHGFVGSPIDFTAKKTLSRRPIE